MRRADLLDAGLRQCVDSARFRGQVIDAYFPWAEGFWFGDFCGAFGPFIFLNTLLGLTILGFGLKFHSFGGILRAKCEQVPNGSTRGKRW